MQKTVVAVSGSESSTRLGSLWSGAPVMSQAPPFARRRFSRAEPTGSLATLGLGTPARVRSVALDAELAAWLRAVGIGEGDGVVVLRRAPFGGPIHVRTRAGGEFALDRELSQAIAIEPLPGKGDAAE